ncbi:N-acetylglucosamine-6-phosphate deacetylase [Solimonas marina]|uniref:N-acetylglucosamine-6-phosphate deacetylase n=1 Tax=Solimonas marina TaxID=2714601 RepID=A0A969W8E7_9GAMM|nr:N-acetylglucosamine-6-phosphate deacetylase [Solimonas marina]NKF22532.1 N-acetylglucosamine-6-phosphate deacetylase [Solimonas marina]
MSAHHTAGRYLTPQGWRRGVIHIEDGRIAVLDGAPAPTAIDGEWTILPGFIDLHVHGGGGADVMDGGDAFTTIARTHARYGTTSLLTTTMTAPREEIEAVLAAIGRHAAAPRPTGSARVLGVHLEGPYINPQKLGAQPDFATTAALEDLERQCAMAPIRVVTIAPEIAGHLDVVRFLSARGIRAQVGHSVGTYEDGVRALEHGASGFTHLFNAMTGLHHRTPGITGAAFAHADYCELIPDLVHVHPGAIRAALRAIPHLYCVSDSTAATGMPDGHYHLGRHRVTKSLGCVRLADGTLAGSTLTLDQALRNLVHMGLSVEDASRRLSTYPADYLGIADRGRIAVGAWADLVALDADLNVVAVHIEGESL